MKPVQTRVLLALAIWLAPFIAFGDGLQPVPDYGRAIGPPAVAGTPAAMKAPEPGLPEPQAPELAETFEGINFDDNGALSGVRFIPPDPITAAGPGHLVAVVNSAIEWYAKSGVRQFRQGLDDFFAPLSPESWPFDPKVIYDQHAARFVVVCLVKVDNGTADPSNVSRMLAAVSDDSDPNGAWHLASIDSRLTLDASVHWADFPGLAVDEEAVYITGNMFTFGTGSFGGSRLWILGKGHGTGGFFDGGPLSFTLHDPSSRAGLPGQSFTMQPAHVFGTSGVANGVGTFLVSCNWSSGIDELVSVIRVDDPLGAPSFSNQFVNLGNIHNASAAFPDAPQAGTAGLIDAGDRRALHAVWRGHSLYVTHAVNSPSGPNAGQATAHWLEIDTADLNAISLVQQGDIGGEDIAPGTHTFYPSIAVDAFGNIGIGFAASAPTLFPGAYYTGRRPTDPTGTVQPAVALAAGVDYYIRTFGTTRNRWGDYSGVSVDPSDDATFWAFNEYALARGTPISGEDGRWGTRFGRFSFEACEGDITGNDKDVDGLDLAALAVNLGLLNLSLFAEDFGRTACP
ncbi:MAG: hypothetical protein MUC33_22995 [Desulfobacterales bacterium]|nr:hypothetical protein [Desulfobacterales bacterium]